MMRVFKMIMVVLAITGAALPASAEPVRVSTRAPDGHHYVRALINGTPVRLLVDTGATVVTLTEADARRVGLKGGRQVGGATAAGEVSFSLVRIGSVSVEGIDIKAVDGAIGGSELPVSLLGQSYLARLPVVTIRGPELAFERPNR